MDSSLYPSWPKYLEDLLGVGGVIEAVPPWDFTALTVSMLIEPTGTIRVLSSADHLHLGAPEQASHVPTAGSNPFFTAAYTIPQCSVDAAQVNAACERIGRACFERQIRGYVSIDFVTFIDARSVCCPSFKFSLFKHPQKSAIFQTFSNIHIQFSNFFFKSRVNGIIQTIPNLYQFS